MEYCICNKKFLSSKQKELAHFPILRCVSLIILCYCKTSWWMVSQGIVLYLFSKTWIMLLISIIFQLCYFFSRTSIVLFEIILSTGALWLLHVSRYCILLLAILWNKVGTWTYCYTSYHILVTMLKVFSRFLFFFLVSQRRAQIATRKMEIIKDLEFSYFGNSSACLNTSLSARLLYFPPHLPLQHFNVTLNLLKFHSYLAQVTNQLSSILTCIHKHCSFHKISSSGLRKKIDKNLLSAQNSQCTCMHFPQLSWVSSKPMVWTDLIEDNTLADYDRGY